MSSSYKSSYIGFKCQIYENDKFRVNLNDVFYPIKINAVYEQAKQETQLSLRDRATRACQLKSGKVLHKCRRLVFEKV